MPRKRAEIDARGRKKVVITIDDPLIADSAVEAEVNQSDVEMFSTEESITIIGENGKRLTITIAE